MFVCCRNDTQGVAHAYVRRQRQMSIRDRDRSPWATLAFIGLCSLGSCCIGFSMGRSFQEPNLPQREVTLGDGTKATCIIVRDAGVTCVPHIVVGLDAEGDKP